MSEQAADAPAAGNSRRKLLLIAGGGLLVAVAIALWFAGFVPGRPEKGRTQQADTQPVYVEMPEIVANLNADGRRQMFVKLKPRIEVAGADDKPLVLAAMPRLLDMFQTYLRDMRPEEMKGSAGTYRLREALIARANIAAAPAHVVDVLLTDLLVQ